MPTGGLVVFRIRLLPMSGASIDAMLQVDCALGDVPRDRSVEGIRLAFEGNGVDPDEPPPEPPETLNVLEHQRYISKLIRWSFEASRRERSRPHLVERDNESEGES